MGLGSSRLGSGVLCHEGGGGGVGDGWGTQCWALLLPALGWLGLEVVEDVFRGLGPRCRRGPGLWLWLGFGSALGHQRVGVAAWQQSWVFAGAWARAVGTGLGGPFGRFSLRFKG